MTSQQQHEFLKSVGGLFDRSIAQPNTVQLAQRLMEDPESQAMYFEFVELDIELEYLYDTRPQHDLFDAAAEMRSVSAEESPQPASCVNVAQILPLPSAALRRGRSFFSASILRYVALVALCLYGSFALIAWNLRPDKLLNIGGSSDIPVAFVRDTADVRWTKNASSKAVESSVLSGEPLKIESGTIELELRTGTKLVVEGPADWSVDDHNRVSLRAGKLVARVPEAAIGFSVETPTAKIVDLGTEFGVEVNESGATDVQVLQGKVQVQLGAKTTTSASARPPITLSAGEALRIETGSAKGEVTVREITPSGTRITRADKPSDKSARARQIPVYGEMASSTQQFVDRDVRFLTNGAGLTGDRHSDQAAETMWNTALGKVQNEFVLFDLSRLYRLESMKVWNFNAAVGSFYRRVGAKHVDIYVSISGKWDPLKEPREWTKVHDHFRLSCASGTADYNTPDVVPLANVEARFVAIVFHDHLNELRPPGGDLQTVGLSEVQFFGERVEPRQSKQPPAKAR